MIEIDYTVEIAASIDEVWEYLWHIPNWAHLMIGYQTVKVVDETHSVWTLKGDVGVLSREVDLEVTIDAWEPRSFLNFTVNGLTEQITGGGTFRIGEVEDGSPAAPAGVAPAPRESWRRRLRRLWAELLFKIVSGGAKTPTGTTKTAPAAGDGGPTSRLDFHLEVSPGGPMAPMIELLMSPLLEPAAKDLAVGIRKELEGREQ
ncbi:CoxG family protein [Nonomuraea sp. M3C6]|uniref:CoxG family protein n=1 Tax=Nonomuraea marmarensis TaxID=3351344 RepID=A0ABW7AIW0_9ACTN